MTRMPWLKLTCVRASAHNVAASGSMRCSRRVKASWAGARSSSPCTFAASVALTERGEAITKLMLSSSEHLGGFTPFFYYIFFNCVTSIDEMKRLAATRRGGIIAPQPKRGHCAASKWRPAMQHIGLDLGKTSSQLCVLSEEGELIEKRVKTGRETFIQLLGGCAPARILIEASTESEWVARHLEALGHEVVVADPNFAPMYATRSRRVKTDRRDAR